MAESVNEQLLHEAIRHALALQRYSNGSVRNILALLNRAGAQIGQELVSALARLPPETFTVQRLDSLLADVQRLNTAAYARLADSLSSDMRALVNYEVGYQSQLFTSVIPAQVLVALPLGQVNPEQVYAGAMARPFQGRLLREWAASQETGAMARVRDAVRIGYTEQQTIAQIVARVRGTRAAGFEDGVLAISRREAEAVVRTAISHTAGYARDQWLSANESLVKEVQWIATLDSRTSPPCILRDKKLYGNDDHKPHGHSLPWGAGPGRLHWNCRSTSVPVVKSFRELGLDIDELAADTRASMEGQVAGDLSYGDWLKKQSAAVQDDVLGPTRGALLRAGEDVDKFSNRKGDWLSIDELRARDAAAFKRAGL